MDEKRIGELSGFYLSELREDILPFWEKNSIDPQKGGFFNYLDREGKLLSTRKTASAQGYGIWLLSNLVEKIEESRTWLALAAGSVGFIRENLRRKSDGRVFSEIEQNGSTALVESSFSPELSIAMGLAAYSRISGDLKSLEEAREIFALLLNLEKTALKQNFPDTFFYRTREFTTGMICLSRELILSDPENSRAYQKQISGRLKEIDLYYTDRNNRALVEYSLPDGSRPEGSDGRLVCPGGSFETIGVMLDEADRLQDTTLQEQALTLLNWTIELGWDSECQGFYSFVDTRGRQPLQLEWDMKIWSCHCSAVLTLLKAYLYTRDPFYETWFETLQEYVWDHFPDKEKGEWFGYLRRDGSVQLDLKGNREKNLYYLPSMLMGVYTTLKRL